MRDSKAFTVELMFAIIGPTDIFVATTLSLFVSGVLYVNHTHIDSCVGTSLIQIWKSDAVPAVWYRPAAMSGPTRKNPVPGIGSKGAALAGDANVIAVTAAASPVTE